jgi:ClpP class serine protease
MRNRPVVRSHQYNREGLLALEPRAFFGFFLEPPTRENALVGDVAIINIKGPLEHHAGWWCDSYDEILERCDAACSTTAHTVLLKLDSPGGLVSGMCETSRALRAKCEAAGKRLVAYADHASSAAYALASSAERIVVPETGFVGSIGVINTRIDARKSAEMYGVAYHIITSGDRKADGHPQKPMTEAELAATQGTVDSLAAVFFGLVAEMRGMSAQDVQALQARSFHGTAAVEAGLADEVQSFDELLASLASAGDDGMAIKPKASKYSEGRAALEEAAKGEGAEAKRARRALAAMDEAPEESAEGDEESDAEGDDPPGDDDEDEESDAEGDDPPGDDDEDEESDAEGDDPPGDDDEDEKDKKKGASARRRGTVSARTAGAVGAAANTFSRRLAKLEAKLEAKEKTAFLASRPDLTPEFRAVLANKPLAEVKELVNAMPKPKARKLGDRAGASTPGATRGAGQGTGTGGDTADPELLAVDRAMGVGKKEPPKAEMRGNTLYLGRAPVAGK